MQSEALSVTLVGPLPGERWVSIQRYLEAILSGQDGFIASVAPTLPDDRYTTIGAFRARYRRLPELLLRMTQVGRLVHITDQALGHLVDCFPQRPTIVTCHDLMPLTLEGHYSSRFGGWLNDRLLGLSLTAMTRATHIIAVSEHTAGEVVRELDVARDRITVVPNMLNDAYRPRERSEEWLRARGIVLPPPPRVLSVGHVRPYKDIERLLRAMGEPVLSQASLVRVGEPLTPGQRALACRQGLDSRVVELGHQDPEVLARVYGACDVLSQQSRGEGFGVPVIEAMACGVPVVCSDGGALPEVAGGAATVVRAGTATDARAGELADAIGGVLHGEALASILRKQGLARAEAFRPDAVIPRLALAYQKALEEHQP